MLTQALLIKIVEKECSNKNVVCTIEPATTSVSIYCSIFREKENEGASVRFRISDHKSYTAKGIRQLLIAKNTKEKTVRSFVSNCIHDLNCLSFHKALQNL